MQSSNQGTMQSYAASAKPLYFSSCDRQLFAWLHPASADKRSSVGLVICKPFGFEAMCGHLSVRAFAEAAAEVGVPALRFDYSGAGDSEDLAPGADQLQAWCEDIESAVLELKRRTGVERVCLLGIRLGALLAAIALPRCPSVHALISVAPTLSGRRFVRELKTFELAAAARATAQKAAPLDTKGPNDGSFEANGFLLTAKTIAALQKVELMELPAPNVADALIIDRDDLAGAKGWNDRLLAAGVATQYQAMPGFVQMLMRPPNLTSVPLNMVAAVREWLGALASRQAHANSLSENLPEATDAAPEMVLRVGSDSTISERTVVLRSDPFLFGIVTIPHAGEVRRRGVILLNSGCDPHIGPRRLHVTMAREWAKNGYFVLRMDISGLGDSAERAGQPRNELFPIEATADAKAGVEFLRDNFGVGDVTLGGICSGASHAVQAAFAGAPVDRLLMVNPLIFYWQPGEVDVDEVQPWEVVHKPAAYFKLAFSAAAWRRLLFGDLSIWRVARIYLTRPLMALEVWRKRIARAMHIRLENDLWWDLKDLKARGVRMVFVFAEGDAGLSLLQLQSGLSQQQLNQDYVLRMINEADHEFTRSQSRKELAQVLSEELYAFNQVSAKRSFDGARSATPLQGIHPTP
jgi:dienelactone hydrolase